MTIKLHDKLRSFRNSAGLTQSYIAKKIGTSTQQYQKYEKGINNISSLRLAEIARLLEISIADFFDDDIKNFHSKKNQPEVGSKLKGEIQVLVKNYQNISSESLRGMILDCAKVCSAVDLENAVAKKQHDQNNFQSTSANLQNHIRKTEMESNLKQQDLYEKPLFDIDDTNNEPDEDTNNEDSGLI